VYKNGRKHPKVDGSGRSVSNWTKGKEEYLRKTPNKQQQKYQIMYKKCPNPCYHYPQNSKDTGVDGIDNKDELCRILNITVQQTGHSSADLSSSKHHVNTAHSNGCHNNNAVSMTTHRQQA